MAEAERSSSAPGRAVFQLKSTFAKLGVADGTEAVTVALTRGLIVLD